MNDLEPPPLPGFAELVARSSWIGGHDGLAEEMLRLEAEIAPVRARANEVAAGLSKPRLSRATARALLVMMIRFAWFAGKGALAALVARLRGGRPGSAGARVASDLVRAGGSAYVKFGQFVATANGVVPDEWIEAFAWCRDEVPVLAPGTAELAVAEAFGRPVSELFVWFSPEPIAAASIAQVHPARLADGTDVMVKVQRPGLRRDFEASIRAMAVLAATADRFKAARIANLPGTVDLFAELVLEELDFRLEALNMVAIGVANEDAGIDYVTVPRPIPGLIAPSVLVMEKVPGVRYTDLVGRGDVDGYRLVRLGIQSVLENALIYGVFHGDLHAGNVLVDERGDFSLVDFGISGRVTARERAALLRLLVAFMGEDHAGVVGAVAEFGALPPDLDLEQAARDFEAHAVALRELTDKPLDTIDLSTLTDQFGGLLRLLAEQRFRSPKELALFSKNLLYLNGLAAALAPDVNLLSEIEPVFGYFLEKYPAEMGAMAVGLVTAQQRRATA